MRTALEAAWKVLECNDSHLATAGTGPQTRLLLAERILRAAKGGETRYGTLLMRALEGLLATPDLPGTRESRGPVYIPA
jgi:hypothetical protein